ncbi:MAG: hypothetical protein IJL06_05915, partial [Kiritimatiellae bacterium]|nr:hypothetical protein [Kiritimatiellia bacterium]
MHSVRSVLVCAALAGAVSASAAEPAATLRIKSAGDLFAAIRDATALAGRPFDGVMAECRFRMLVDAAGIELRDDEPILFAMKPKPVPADAPAVPFFDPPPFALSVPMPPLSAGSLAVFGATNAPAPGEWIGGEGGAPCFSWRDGRAYFAVGEGGRALAEGLAAAPAPRSAGALFEVAVDEPLAFQEKLLAAEDGVAPGTPFSEVAANIAAALGVPGLAPRIEALFDVSRKNARDVERGVFDVWFDATNGFAFATAAVAREGSGLAARLAAVPALDPAALPAVSADAPFWGVSSRPDAGEVAE